MKNSPEMRSAYTPSMLFHPTESGEVGHVSALADDVLKLR
jgi:hypothetical protein